MRPIRIWLVCLGGWSAGVCALAAMPLSLAHELEGPGLTMVHTGVGLGGWSGDLRVLELVIPGEVELALLYWAGRDRPCAPDPDTGVCMIASEPYKDQVLRLDGEEVVGTVLGTEYQPSTSRGPILNIGYGADVTDLVRRKGSGEVSFELADGDSASDLAHLTGASLLVLATDPLLPPARAIVFHGLDFAYGEDRMHGETEITEAATFNHGAARSPRQGRLVLFAGDCERGRPDRIDITNNASLLNQLDGSAGAEWDADSFPVEIPGGAVATAVQIFSEPWGQNPDSLLWIAAALSLPLPAATGCPAEVWHGDTKLWKGTGINPGQRVKHVFQGAVRYALVGEATLRTALRFQEHAGLLGAAKSLMRQGAAALLNGLHPALELTYTRTEVINRVGEALRRRDEEEIRALAAELKAANEAGCPLD